MVARGTASVAEMTNAGVKISLTLIFLPLDAESCLLRQTACER